MIKVNDQIVNFQTFNDGTCKLKYFTPDNVLYITWLYENDEEAMFLYFLTKHMRDHMGIDKTLGLNLPYVPNGRMDRVQDSGDVFTLKYFAQFINSLKFDWVRIYDPHSYVTSALINHVIVDTPKEQVRQLLEKYPSATVCFPDGGAMHKYRSLFEVPYLFGIKLRDWETQRLMSLQLMGSAKHNVAGHDILIIDDICGTGGTIAECARGLKGLGARDVYVFVSHCENTVLKPNLAGCSLLDIPNLITKLYTTNSIFTGQHEKVEILHKFN